jgi:hypothetical protein
MIGVPSKASSYCRTLLLFLWISGSRDLRVILERARLQVCNEMAPELLSDSIFRVKRC